MKERTGIRTAGLRCTETMAGQLLSQADQLESRGDPEQAAAQFQKALRLYDRLLKTTGDREYGRLARECCTSLADCQIQLGNLHGADVYYVMALTYEPKKF